MAKFLAPATYGAKLREVQAALGPNATNEGAVQYLNDEGIYKDTEANRAKYGADEAPKAPKAPK